MPPNISRKSLLIITDAAPSANSSTSREVVDLIDECNRSDVATHIYSAWAFSGDIYQKATSGRYSKTLFYKSQNFILRFISENFLGVVLALKYLMSHKNKNDITNVLWISPSVFNIYLALAVRLTTNAKIYLMLRDIFPYWLASIGRLNPHGLIYAFLNMFARFQSKIAHTVGVESDRSLEIFKRLFPADFTKCEVLHNWMSTTPLEHVKNEVDSTVKFLYAGSLGLAQGHQLLIELIQNYKNSIDVEFHMIGKGEGFTILRQLKISSQLNNLWFHEELSLDKIDSFTRKFDIGLVFLDNDLDASNIPGKAMGYMLNGLPVFGSVNPGNDLPKLLEENDLGMLDISGDVSTFLKGAKEMLQRYRKAKYSRNQIRNSSMSLFSPSVALRQILI